MTTLPEEIKVINELDTVCDASRREPGINTEQTREMSHATESGGRAADVHSAMKLLKDAEEVDEVLL